MSLPIVVEFKERIFDVYNLKLKTYRLSNIVLVEIRSPKLLVHPPIVFNLSDKTLDIGLAPFVVVDSPGSYMLYSTVIENSEKKLRVSDSNTYEFTILDSNSILVYEGTTGKILKILRASIDDTTIEQIDMLNLDVHTKAVHSTIHNYAIFLTDKKELHKLTFSDEKPFIEFLSRCDLYSVGKFKTYTSTLCMDDSYLHVVIGNRIYGFYTKLADKSNKHIDYIYQTYGYVINNIAFTKLGIQSYVLRLDTPNTEIHHNALSILKPIAILDDNTLVAVAPKDGAIALLNLEKNTVSTVAKVNFGELLDIDVNIEQSSLILTYSDRVYLLEVSEKPRYIKLKSEDTLSATLARDSLVIFRKNTVDVYKLDVASNHVYLEKIDTIPRYIIQCRTLTRDIILCIDRLGRIIVSRLKNMFIARSCQYIPLRGDMGTVTYVYGTLTPLALDLVYEGKSIKVSSSKTLLYMDNEEILRRLTAYENRNRMQYKVTDKVFIDIPESIDDINILILGDKIVIINNKGCNYKHTYTYLSIIDGIKTTKIPLDAKQVKNVNSFNIFKKFTKVFLAKEQGVVEFGISIDKSRIKVIDYDNMLYHHGDYVCLSDHLNNMLMSSTPTKLIAICSNTITGSTGKCVDLRSCEKLLKLILEVEGDMTISIPIQQLSIPKSIYMENIDRIDVTYIHGLQYLILPRKCVDIAQAFLRLDKAKNVLILSLINRCKNVSAILNVKNYVLPIEPNNHRDIEIEIELDDMINDNGIQILILEGIGNILRYSIKLDLEFFISKAIGIALKIAKIIGVRAGVIKNLNHAYKDNGERYRENSF